MPLFVGRCPLFSFLGVAVKNLLRCPLCGAPTDADGLHYNYALQVYIEGGKVSDVGMFAKYHPSLVGVDEKKAIELFPNG